MTHFTNTEYCCGQMAPFFTNLYVLHSIIIIISTDWNAVSKLDWNKLNNSEKPWLPWSTNAIKHCINDGLMAGARNLASNSTSDRYKCPSCYNKWSQCSAWTFRALTFITRRHPLWNWRILWEVHLHCSRKAGKWSSEVEILFCSHKKRRDNEAQNHFL